MALYPGTSSFYPGTVAKRVDRAKGNHEYHLQFDDDEQDASGAVIVKRVGAGFVIENY